MAATPTTLNDDIKKPHRRILNDSATLATSTAVSLPPSLQSDAHLHIEGAVKIPGEEIQQSEAAPELAEATMNFSNASRRSQWIILALASGGCAAFNGMFAKLTTTELTTTWATFITGILDLGEGEKYVEVVIRALFFALNLLFNGIMWALFTKALARGTSTTQVSILNTSSNFMITAILGFIIFSESLPPLWFLGAGMLVAGNVIIGRRDESEVGGVKLEDADDEEERLGGDADGLLGRSSFELREDLEGADESKGGGRGGEGDLLDLDQGQHEGVGGGQRMRITH